MKYSKFPRIFLNDNLSKNKKLTLDKENSNYLKNVMRLKDGYKLRVFNSAYGEYEAEFFSGKECCVSLKDKLREPFKTNEITLLVSIIKQDKFELVCDMATQIGVTDIIPITTERVQKKELNIERIRKVIFESVRQSERFVVPEINYPIELQNIDFNKYNKIYFANENETGINLNYINNKIGILVGPEGGFTNKEIEFLIKKDNVESVSLGNGVLRAETATVVLLSRVTHKLGI